MTKPALTVLVPVYITIDPRYDRPFLSSSPPSKEVVEANPRAVFFSTVVAVPYTVVDADPSQFAGMSRCAVLDDRGVPVAYPRDA